MEDESGYRPAGQSMCWCARACSVFQATSANIKLHPSNTYKNFNLTYKDICSYTSSAAGIYVKLL